MRTPDIEEGSEESPEPVTVIESVSSKTTLLPANNSRVEPEGIGAFVTNSTLALAPLLVPDGGLLAVSESRDTVVVT